ncbi:MAG TPA: hypothetical protein VFD43_11405 [Planctomycetota bacterium]|nr:hypothetical protein [Planctomycetota bacterium]
MAERPPLAERPLAVLAACLGLAFCVYWPSLSDGFYNDDALFLNMSARVLEQPARLFTERPLGYFRPGWLAYMAAQKAVFGLAPAGYHVVGVVLHGLAGFLVWLLARRLLRDGAAALAAAAAFLCLFAHSEAVYWIAAHNSTLAAGLCVGAVLLHLRAIETGRASAALLTAAVVLLALWTKEPSAVLLAWLPLSELLTAGWRSPFTRAGLLRAALIAAAVGVFVLSNPSVGTAFQGKDQLANTEIRATFAFLEPGRVLEACATLLSPLPEPRSHAGPGPGGAALSALALLLPLAVVARLRPPLLRPTALALLLMLTAMVPASMTRLQQPNGSRLYYFPTVGAALLLGVALALARGSRPLRAGLAVALAAFLGWHVAAIRASGARDYGPISAAQTRTAEELGPVGKPARVACSACWPISCAGRATGKGIARHGMSSSAASGARPPWEAHSGC